METLVTVFKNINDVSEPKYVPLSKILDSIKNGSFKSKIESIRHEKNKVYQSKLKSKLASILFSSSKQNPVIRKGKETFRSDEGLVEHSGLICIDLDDFEDEFVMIAKKNELMEDEYVLSVFDSPSDEGLKVLFKIPKEKENHRAYFYGLKKHLNTKYFDDSSVNESRVCYISYDEEIYINYESKVFDKKGVKEKFESKTKTSKNNLKTSNDIISNLHKWWEERYGLKPNQRNKNCYILAMAFNEFGISVLDARSFMLQFQQHDFDSEEINRIIDSAYSKNHLFNTKSFEDNKSIEEYKPKNFLHTEEPIVNYQNIYKQAFIDVTKTIEYPPVAISIGTHTTRGKSYPIPFGTYGNFSCIQGASKSKKTFLKSLLLASFIGGQTTNYTKRIKSHRDSEVFIIDCDTEQSTYHAQNAFKRVMRLVGVDSYEYYKPFALRPYEPKERLQFLDWLFYESELKDNIGLVSIDGLADLLNDFNDIKESQNVIQKVMKWTYDKQFHLTTILHSNFGTNKAVGHVGSFMLKKAETVCLVSTEGDSVRANFSHTRGFPIEDFNYAVDDDGLPYILNERTTDYFIPEKDEVVEKKATLAEAFEVDDIPF